MTTILFQTGGPFHPVEAQAKLIRSWLPDDWKITTAFGTDVFEQLDNADAYVAGGLHWTGLKDLSTLIGTDPEPPIWESAQVEKHPYVPPTEVQKGAFRKYVQSGQPILSFHSGIFLPSQNTRLHIPGIGDTVLPAFQNQFFDQRARGACTLTLRLRSSNSLPTLRVDLPSREVRKITADKCSTSFNTASSSSVESH